MKLLTIVAAALLFVGCAGNNQNTNSESTEANANVNFYQNFLNEQYRLNAGFEKFSFNIYEDKKDGQCFNLLGGLNLDWDWYVSSKIKQSTDNANLYTFEGKEILNDSQDAITGSFEFVKDGNDGVKVVFSNLNDKAKEFFPNELVFHAVTESELINELNQNLVGRGYWEGDENNLFVTLNLLDQNNNLGEFEYYSTNTTYKIEKVASWDAKNNAVTVETQCSNGNTKGSIKIVYNEEGDIEVTVLEGDDSDSFCKKGNTYKCHYVSLEEQ